MSVSIICNSLFEVTLRSVSWVCSHTLIEIRVPWVCSPTCIEIRVSWVCSHTLIEIRVSWVCLPTPIEIRVSWVYSPTGIEIRASQVCVLTHAHTQTQSRTRGQRGFVHHLKQLTQSLRRHLSNCNGKRSYRIGERASVLTMFFD